MLPLCSLIKESSVTKACRTIVLLPLSASLQSLRIEKGEREKALIEKEIDSSDIQNVRRRNL
jgi:hypothetical protein